MIKYVFVKNFGKNFINKEDKNNFHIKEIVTDLWEIEDNISSQNWIIRVGALEKTKEEAQIIVNDHLNKTQDYYNNLSEQEKQNPMINGIKVFINNYEPINTSTAPFKFIVNNIKL